MQAVSLAFWGYFGACAVAGARRRPGRTGRMLCALLVLSMSVTCVCVVQSGQSLVHTLLPLHLCSLCALLAAAFYLHPARGVYHFLWYLGMPGAALALLFPSVLQVPWQAPLEAAFFSTHALIVLSPLWHAAGGTLPAPAAAPRALAQCNLFAALVYAVDRLLGVNYLFLLAAPPGTPLAFFESLGRIPYLLSLEAAAALCVGAMALAARGLARRPGTWYNPLARDSDPSGNAVR